MKTYNGGSISNIVKNLGRNQIYVTDTPERATRYANAQATGIVRGEMNQELAEGAALLEVECEPRFFRRSASHTSLDTCEAVIVDNFVIRHAILHFREQNNTLYGLHPYRNERQVVELLERYGITVEIV